MCLCARVLGTDGGKAAMRLPAVLTQYALSVCSGDFDDWVTLNACTNFAGRYSCSICAGDFNDWIAKNVSTAFRGSYVFTGEWVRAHSYCSGLCSSSLSRCWGANEWAQEMQEWKLGTTFNYAEMAMCIAPRPFMVERGHDDGVGLDHWVAWEYAKVRRGYAKLGIPERTTIEYFDGPHTINGVGTYQFLHEHLGVPVPRL